VPAALIWWVCTLGASTLVWLVVLVTRWPLAWAPGRWVTGVELAACAVAGALVRRAGLGVAAASAAGLAVGVLVSLEVAVFGPRSELGSMLDAVLPQATLVPAVLGAVGALVTGSGTRRGSGDPWRRDLQAVAVSACACALLWRGPRLHFDGALRGTESGRPPDLWGAFDVLAHVDLAALWPAPVAAALGVCLGLAAVCWANREWAGRGRVRVLLAVFAGGAWLLAEGLLARPWSDAVGALCGALQLGALMALAPRRAPGPRRERALSTATLMVATLLLGQFVLGAAQRQQPSWLWVHVLFGVALVLPAVLHLGVRAWLGGAGVSRRLPLILATGVTGQLVLGVTAISTPPSSPRLDVLVASLHLWGGVALIAAVGRWGPWGAASGRERPPS
jgi:hypothetical protein